MERIKANREMTSNPSLNEAESRFSKLVSLKQLAHILGKSENSMRYHFKKGRIRPKLKLGRNYAFDPDDVFKQLQKGLS